MNVADLLSIIKREVQTDLPDAELISLLNEEQLELAVDFKVPTQTVAVGPITTDFTLPNSTQYNALLSAQDEWGRHIELLTVNEANVAMPSWTRTDYAGMTPWALIYDPANISAPVRPLPNPSAASNLRFTVALRPPDLAELTDVPFGGELRDTHQVLAYGVIARLLLRQGDNRASAYFGKREELKNMTWHDTRPAPMRVRRYHSRFRSRSWR